MSFISAKVLLSILVAEYLFVSLTQSHSAYIGRYRCCRDGQKGNRGYPGRIGERGIRGERGEPGLPGRCSSQVLESVTLTSPTSKEDMKGVRRVLNQLFGACVEDLLDETGSQMSTFTVIKGEKGERGDMGLSIKGEVGLPGEQGPIGPQGMKGERGAAGNQGIMGGKGDKGEKGCEGPVGPVGATGVPGPVGPPGETGVQGPKGDRGQTGQAGLVYVRWGDNRCPPNAVLLYEGIITQAASKMANLLCIPKSSSKTSPAKQYTMTMTTTTPPSHVTRMEPLLFTNLQGVVDAVPCARCYDSSHSTEFTFPGSTACPTDWTRQYYGHLITSYELSTSDVLCGDERLTRAIQWGDGSYSSKRNGVNMIETVCGKDVLSCRGHSAGQLTSCVVCSK